jgi:uncharacterized damage-inducible protein DinB
MRQPMADVRKRQLGQLRMAVTLARQIAESAPPEALAAYRDGGSGWTVLEVIGHLCDFDAVFEERARLTLTRDMPALAFPDPNPLVIAGGYNAQPLAAVLGAWQAARDSLIAVFAAVPEDAWDRAGVHPTRGPYSLDDQLLYTPYHDMDHLGQIVKILRERRA